jgi:hypothetical protein
VLVCEAAKLCKRTCFARCMGSNPTISKVVMAMGSGIFAFLISFLRGFLFSVITADVEAASSIANEWRTVKAQCLQ